MISLLSSSFLALHIHGVNRHIAFPKFNTTDRTKLSYMQWCLSDSSWQWFYSLEDNTIASFMTSQRALWPPCCIMTSHSTLCPFALIKKGCLTFRVVTDKNHELGSLEKYVFNQTTFLSRPFCLIKLSSSRSLVVPPHRLCVVVTCPGCIISPSSALIRH